MASFNNNSNRRTNNVKRQESQDDPPAYDSDDEASPCPSNVRQESTEPNSNGNGNGRRSSDNKNKTRKRKRSQPPPSTDNQTSNLLGVSSASSSAEILVPKRSRLDNNDNNEGDPDLDSVPPDGTPIKARRARRKRRKHHSHPQRNKSRVPVGGGAEPEPESSPVITVATVPLFTTTDSNSILSLDNRSSVSNAEDFELVQEFNNLYASARLFEQPSNGLRPIAIDGCNVAWGHGNDQEFSYKGIVLCADFFRARGHRVKVFVPRHHQPKIPREIVDELIKAEILVFTPSRNPGKQGKRIVSYDDRFIVQYAVCTGGVVISNDNFNDLFDEQPTWRDTITNRVLQHTWISKDILMFPLDPMGRRGKQSLNDFLRFPQDTIITIPPSSLGTLPVPVPVPVPVEVDPDVVPGGVSSKSKTKADSSTCSMNAQCSSPSRTSTHSLKLDNTSGPSSSSLEGKSGQGRRTRKESTRDDFDIFNIDLDYVSDRISSRVKADVQKSYVDALASDSDDDEV